MLGPVIRELCSHPEKLDYFTATNEEPSISDIPWIQELESCTESLATSIDSDITELERQIQQAQRHLQLLHMEKVDITCAISIIKSIAGPIRRLPNEILEEIFIWTKIALSVESHAYLSKSNWVLRGETPPAILPWVLSAVSRRWRLVSLSLPLLWDLVFIKDDRYDILALHISRTKNIPLHIHFIIPPGTGPFWLGKSRVILASTIPRWRTLSIDGFMPFEPAIKDSLGWIRGTLHSLTSFRAHSIAQTHLKDLLIDTPHLRHLTGRPQDLVTLSNYTHIIMDTLTLLCDNYSPSHKVHELLRLSNNLKTLRVFGEVPFPGRVNVHQLVVANLTHLTIGVSDHSLRKISNLLNLLFLPSLHYLHFSCEPEGIVESLCNLIRRSSCTIQELYIEADSRVELIDIFPVVPSLTVLKVELTGSWAEASDMLFLRFLANEGSTFLPFLKKFVFDGSVRDCLRDISEARPMLRVYVYDHDDPGEDQLFVNMDRKYQWRM